jgi:hypothetical protein
LSFRPPACGDALHACSTFNVTDTGSHQSLWLASTSDWILQMPAVPVHGGLDINGGHNVILIGGEIDLTTPCTSDTAPCHGINISTGPLSTGEIYIEGVLIKNPDASHSHYTGDGIDVDTTNVSTITLQNIRIEGIDGCNSGAYPGAHADVFQPYGAGGALLRVDHLTGTTDYQGMQIDPDYRAPARGDYRNVNITMLPNTHAGCTGGGPGYLWWLTYGATTCTSYPMSLSNVWATEPNGTLQYNAVWPDTNATFGCPANYVNGYASWPGIPLISGGVHNGPPPTGDFVPPGLAGLGYR